MGLREGMIGCVRSECGRRGKMVGRLVVSVRARWWRRSWRVGGGRVEGRRGVTLAGMEGGEGDSERREERRWQRAAASG